MSPTTVSYQRAIVKSKSAATDVDEIFDRYDLEGYIKSTKRNSIHPPNRVSLI
jgi:hypothetical protein